MFPSKNGDVPWFSIVNLYVYQRVTYYQVIVSTNDRPSQGLTTRYKSPSCNASPFKHWNSVDMLWNCDESSLESSESEQCSKQTSTRTRNNDTRQCRTYSRNLVRLGWEQFPSNGSLHNPLSITNGNSSTINQPSLFKQIIVVWRLKYVKILYFMVQSLQLNGQPTTFWRTYPILNG